jgi:hypothetical protein
VKWEGIDREAVLKAVGLSMRDPNAQALVLTCERYGLDPLLRHMVLIQGRPYVTRDGLLHVAHRSGQLDGIEVVDQGESQTHFVAKVSVYRKDMSKAFTYIGRYPKAGQNKTYGPEMAVKCGEVMALRRAFDVALAAQEEMWDQVDGVTEPPPPQPSAVEEEVIVTPEASEPVTDSAGEEEAQDKQPAEAAASPGEPPSPADPPEGEIVTEIEKLRDELGMNQGQLLRFARETLGKHVTRSSWAALGGDDAQNLLDALKAKSS